MLPSSGWFAVRCLFRCGWPPADAADDSNRYEERITLWRAGSLDEAVAKAEAEAHVYGATIDEARPASTSDLRRPTPSSTRLTKTAPRCSPSSGTAV